MLQLIDVKKDYFVGAGFTFNKDNIKVDIIDSLGENLRTEIISK